MVLDGQELTLGFLLKVLVLLVISGGIFLYYLREIRNVINPKERNAWRAFATAFIIASILSGFGIIGSPAAQRERRYDSQRVNDLQSLQWQLVNYWQQKEVLPNNLETLADPFTGYMIPTDPKTEAPYEYQKTNNLSFNLCATFDRSTEGLTMYVDSIASPVPALYPDPSGKIPESWQHEAGRQCFERTIDPELYPPTKSFR